MPATRSTVSPANDWVSGRITGMAPATAASKYRSTWARSAARARSPVELASSALLAVTTDLPCSIAVMIAARAGSTGPINSTTMSTSSRDTSPSMSSVSSPIGTPRLALTRRTPTPRRTSGAPMRAARSAALFSMMRTTSLPTLPYPSTATPTGFCSVATAHLQAQQIIHGLPAQHQPGVTVTHRHHRRAAHQVVSARHRVTVGAGGGHREQVPRLHIPGNPGVTHDDIPTLTVFSDYTEIGRATW